MCLLVKLCSCVYGNYSVDDYDFDENVPTPPDLHTYVRACVYICVCLKFAFNEIMEVRFGRPRNIHICI